MSKICGINAIVIFTIKWYKVMSCEKKYNEALERAKSAIKECGNNKGRITMIEEIFPELKENKDEGIRKAIISIVAFSPEAMFDRVLVTRENCLAWLEKQGERKTPRWMIDFLDDYRRKIGCSLDYDEARDVDGKILCIKDWLEKQDEVKESLISQRDNTTCKENDNSLTGEDERIRKELCKAIWTYIQTEEGRAYIAWIEKQGAQKQEWSEEDEKMIESAIQLAHEYGRHGLWFWLKSLYLEKKPQGKSALETVKDEKVDNADKVKPKFDVDDWIICNEILVKIVDCENIRYTIETTEGSRWAALIDTVDRKFHLWTIKDAKKGDVLSFNDGHGNDCIELIKSITDKKIEFWFCLTNGNCYEVFDGIIPYTNLISRKDATPATKEQRDLLFSKMHEAGYEWDDKKLELKKIASDNAEQHDRCLGWLKKDADMFDFLMALFEDTFPDMNFRPLAHMDRKEPITSKDIVNWSDNLKPIIDYTYVWHDVTKELPPKRKGFHLSEYVLVYDKYGVVYISAYDYSKKCWKYNNYFVTHWAYIPEPPKTE